MFGCVSNQVWSIWALMRGNRKPQDEAEGRRSPQFDALPAGNLQPLLHLIWRVVGCTVEFLPNLPRCTTKKLNRPHYFTSCTLPSVLLAHCHSALTCLTVPNFLLCRSWPIYLYQAVSERKRLLQVFEWLFS